MRSYSPLLAAVLAACSTDVQVQERANVAPAASINTPTNGASALADSNIDFAGVIADGNGLDDVVTVTWSSSLDGELSSPILSTPDAQGITRISSVLSPGVHAITLRATDAAGAVGEDTITLSVGAAQQAPIVSISSPTAFANYFLGADVQLIASVSDAQQAPDTLSVDWIAENQTTGQLVTLWSGAPDPNGLVLRAWNADATGNFLLTVRATDDDGNEGEAVVAIRVENPSGIDLDGDGFSEINGDCDDTNPAIHPGAPEICGDNLDNDCSAVIDDKDVDNDQHVDAACVNYVGPLPVDDCNDANSQVFPGAAEVLDGLDNDCDGLVDESTSAFDDDGDCACEAGPCTGSTNASCPALVGGDCDDGDADVGPNALDLPDLNGTDNNCDGVDGTITSMVFVNPTAGNNASSGLTPGQAVADLNRAYFVASTSGRSQVAIAQGNLSFSGALTEGVSLYGGYATSGGAWTRTGARPVITADHNGLIAQNWTTPTTFQKLEIRSGAAPAGQSSIAMRVISSNGVSLEEVHLRAGAGGQGPAGTGGNTGAVGNVGSGGTAARPENAGFLGACGGPNDQAFGGAGGTSGVATTGGRGGRGGSNDSSRPQQTDGDPGIGPGGGGGAKAAGGDRNGSVGSPGLQGSEGSAGLPGAAIGAFGVGGYTAADGTPGGVGGVGGGGGGGGGARGGENQVSCDIWGGSGGGGGGGGLGGTGGTGGGGGGASVALLAVSSNLSTVGAAFTTERGGDGGDGGAGGSGGLGGLGGPGGANGGNPLLFDAAGGGGNGGDGGQGGRGGHGGGGGGGPSVGVVCRLGGNVGLGGSQYTIGPGGTGGTGPGSPGQPGSVANSDGC